MQRSAAVGPTVISLCPYPYDPRDLDEFEGAGSVSLAVYLYSRSGIGTSRKKSARVPRDNGSPRYTRPQGVQTAPPPRHSGAKTRSHASMLARGRCTISAPIQTSRLTVL